MINKYMQYFCICNKHFLEEQYCSITFLPIKLITTAPKKHIIKSTRTNPVNCRDNDFVFFFTDVVPLSYTKDAHHEIIPDFSIVCKYYYFLVFSFSFFIFLLYCNQFHVSCHASYDFLHNMMLGAAPFDTTFYFHHYQLHKGGFS